jgi:polysaccharide export outer membrane protein
MQELRHVRFRRPFARAAVSLVLIGAALAMSACTRGRGGPVAYDPPDFVPPDAQSVVATAVQQRIAPLDKIRVTVFQVADMTGEYTVDASGNIEFPLLGTVAAQGLLPAELGQRLAERLGQRYLRSPSVTVTMLQQAEQTITVDGAVRQPGVVPIRGSTTLMQAVALGRGAAEDANINRVIVFRTINGQRMAAAFDLQAIRRGQAQDPAIYGNDIVVVDGSRTRTIWRDIIGAIPLVGIFAPYIAR